MNRSLMVKATLKHKHILSLHVCRMQLNMLWIHKNFLCISIGNHLSWLKIYSNECNNMISNLHFIKPKLFIIGHDLSDNYCTKCLRNKLHVTMGNRQWCDGHSLFLKAVLSWHAVGCWEWQIFYWVNVHNWQALGVFTGQDYLVCILLVLLIA